MYFSQQQVKAHSRRVPKAPGQPEAMGTNWLFFTDRESTGIQQFLNGLKRWERGETKNIRKIVCHHTKQHFDVPLLNYVILMYDSKKEEP